MPRPFTKPATTIAQQLQHLQAEGMAIPDVVRAEHWLRHVSYYRLNAYWLPFEYPKGASGARFLPGTSFDTVTALYDFDRRLRLLVLDAIERIEVAVRGSWAYELAQRFGPHGYLDAALYYHPGKYHDNLTRLTNDVASSPETYIDHYRRTYSTPAMPPVWMVAEMMSFGQLSRWYALLDDRGLRNAIATPLGLPEAVLVPLLKHLSTIRNSCAHHPRLWNRGFLLRMRVPFKPAALVSTLEPPAARAPAQLYNAVVLIDYLLRQVAVRQDAACRAPFPISLRYRHPDRPATAALSRYSIQQLGQRVSDGCLRYGAILTVLPDAHVDDSQSSSKLQ